MWALLTKQSLWKNVLQAKYLAPLTILNWIRAKNKQYPTASTQCRSLTKVFPLIGNFLTWKSKRSQHQDRLRCNNWVRSQHISQSGTHSDTHFKAQDTSHLESASKMGVDHSIETRLALSSRFKLRGTLESGLAKLHRLSDSSTYPPLRITRRAWSFATVEGVYTARLGYKSQFDPVSGEVLWWHKQIWTIKAPPKLVLFFWLIMKGRAQTCDRLRKMGFQGPSICQLCAQAEETIPHLFLHCKYLRQV